MPFFDECCYKKIIAANFNPRIDTKEGVTVCLENNVVVSLGEFNRYFAQVKPIIDGFIEENNEFLNEYLNELINHSGKTDNKENEIYNWIYDNICHRGYVYLSKIGARNLDIGKNIFELYETSKKILEYISKHNKEE